MSASAVELQDVTKRFGDFAAVEALSLVVPEGGVCGFIGPNGSGKTTTLRLIMRIYSPDAGHVRVLGDESVKTAHDEVTYLPEERMLYKHMKVYEVLRFLSQLKGHTPTKREIDDWLERMELPGVGARRVQTLSKGQSQKIQLIAVLISKPKLVLLDEPFSGLDPVNAVVLRETVLSLKKQGTTVIFSTHDMAVAEKMCDAIVMIYKGRKVLDGSLSRIQSTYGDDTVRVRYAHGRPVPEGLPGVAAVTDFGRYQELRCVPGADRPRLLTTLMAAGEVELFEVARPSLQDIFVRLASPDALRSEVALA